MKYTDKKYFLTQLQISPNNTMADAIKTIEVGHVQMALVVDQQRKLIGTVTDGDIRRALLRGESLESPVERFMYREFRALSAIATEEEALALLKREMLQQIPALDESGKVLRLFLLEELILPKKRTNPVVIMAGGEGKRLQPLTHDCPKPMLKVGGKPLLEIIIQQCIDAGFQRFYLAVNFLKERIQEHFGNGERWNIHIDYLEEDQKLGTAGALSLLPETPNEPFLVLNGDVLTRVNFGRLFSFHEEHDAVATLCVREHVTQIPYGVVQIDELRVLGLEEKPLYKQYVNAGIYLLDPTILTMVPKNQFFDMPQLLERSLQSQQRISAFPIHEYWLDIGNPETFERAHSEWT